jgi:hypothetical protein
MRSCYDEHYIKSPLIEGNLCVHEEGAWAMVKGMAELELRVGWRTGASILGISVTLNRCKITGVVKGNFPPTESDLAGTD